MNLIHALLAALAATHALTAVAADQPLVRHHDVEVTEADFEAYMEESLFAIVGIVCR